MMDLLLTFSIRLDTAGRGYRIYLNVRIHDGAFCLYEGWLQFLYQVCEDRALHVHIVII